MIVDSSLFIDHESMEKLDEENVYLKYGVVKDVIFFDSVPYIKYLVEITEAPNNVRYINCISLSKYGSPFNYEHVVHNPYPGTGRYDEIYTPDSYKSGSKVMVMGVSGSLSDGIILGCIQHPANEARLQKEDGIVYSSEFNGVNIKINKHGEYMVMFKGVPTNIKETNVSPKDRKSQIPSPKYNSKISGSYFMFHKDGSIELNDANKQGIMINKQNEVLRIKSGENVLIFEKNNGKVTFSIENNLTTAAKESINIYTKKHKTEATDNFLVKSPKVAFGTNENELLQEIIKMVDELSKCTPISPVGPCAAMTACPQWGGVDKHKNNIKKIKGVLP